MTKVSENKNTSFLYSSRKLVFRMLSLVFVRVFIFGYLLSRFFKHYKGAKAWLCCYHRL